MTFTLTLTMTMTHPDNTRGDERHLEGVGVFWRRRETEERVDLCKRISHLMSRL
jgi:hypothetical protein